MSRIGRLPITVPQGVTVTIQGSHITVSGPRGELQRDLAPEMRLVQEDGAVRVERPADDKRSRELHGLTRTLVANMVTGVTTGFSKSLEIVGVGYRVQPKGEGIEFALGYSHPIQVDPPAGIAFTVESPTRLTVTGIDKQKVGEVAANIRKLRKPEPYKGKGIRYSGEVVRRKVGKAGK